MANPAVGSGVRTGLFPPSLPHFITSSLRHLLSPKQLPEGLSRVGLGHEVLAHQDDVHPVLAELGQVGRATDPRLADDDATVLHQVEQAEGVPEVGVHRLEVAVVDAQQ